MASNGYIPTSELTSVGNDVYGAPAYLASGSAADFKVMRAACKAETGVDLQISPDGGAYRTFAQQEAAWVIYQNGGPNAATPGTSNHGLGKAVDVWNWAAVYQWLLSNCGRFGFENNYQPEGWHYQHLSDAAVAGSIESDDDMMIFWVCVADSKDGKFVNGRRYAQASPVSPVVPYGDPSTLTAIGEQFPGFSQNETRISGNDLSRLASYYNVTSSTPGSGITADQARQIAVEEDNKLRIGK